MLFALSPLCRYLAAAGIESCYPRSAAGGTSRPFYFIQCIPLLENRCLRLPYADSFSTLPATNDGVQ